jgi:NADP-dependent 3-hydroxy acid dehydrogenase YdfG
VIRWPPMRRRDDVSNLVELACERFGKLDVLVNNAGIMPVSPLDELRVEDWGEMIDINMHPRFDRAKAEGFLLLATCTETNPATTSSTRNRNQKSFEHQGSTP